MKDRVLSKIAEIVDNPEIGEPKCYELKGLWGDHVNPFVIIYAIVGNKIVFQHTEGRSNTMESPINFTIDIRMMNTAILL